MFLALRKSSGHGAAVLTCKAAKGGQPGNSNLTLLLLPNARDPDAGGAEVAAGAPDAGKLLPNAGGIGLPDGGAELAVGAPDAGQLLPDAGVEPPPRPGCKCRAKVSVDLQASKLQTSSRACPRAKLTG